MNWNYFNTLGYVSVILWISMPLLWLVHSRMKPRRWLVHIALLCGIAALVLANINSKSHVALIQQDQSEQLADLQAEKDAKLKAALEDRGEDVADIRFAEDDATDFLDRAGMDESDLKYLDKINRDATPAWKAGKKNRSTQSDDAGLEDLIGAEEETQGIASEELENAAPKEPIMMSAKDMQLANRLDSLNLKTIRFIILLSVIFIIIDYLRRANSYHEAYLPLPVPGPWLRSMNPLPAVVQRPQPPRRDIPDELAWLAKRGDSFLYMGPDPSVADHLTEKPLPYDDGETRLTEEFVFENLWHKRASFTVHSHPDSLHLLNDFIERLEKRTASRAHVRQPVHVVWDHQEPIPAQTLTVLERLASATGFSLFLCHDPR